MSLELHALKNSILALENSISAFQNWNHIQISNRKGKEISESSVTRNDINTLNTLKAGVIQHFEVAYEQCCKFMKRWLEENISEQIATGVPRIELFRISAENKLIPDVEEWMNFHRARNLTSHTYDEDNAEKVFSVALAFLFPAKDLLKRIEARNA